AAVFCRFWNAAGKVSLRQLVEIFDKRHYCPLKSLYFRIRGFGDVILVRRVRAAAVPQSEMACRKVERFAGKDVTRIRTCIARPEQRIDSEFFVSRYLRFDERRISRT